MITQLINSDLQLSRTVHQLELGIFDFTIAVFALLCSVWGVPILIYLVFTNFGQSIAAIYMLLTLLGVIVTSQLKRVIDRERPKVHGKRLIPLRWMENNASFPSGDSFQAAIFSVLMIYASGAWIYYFTILPLVMFARVYFGFHWISDTLCGAALGSVITFFILAFLFQ